MSLLISLRSEWLKNKRTPAVYLCLLTAVLAAVFSYMDSSAAYKVADLKHDPWNIHLTGMGGLALNMMILPIYLMLACTLLAQVEYRNGTWKQVYVSPQPLWQVFLAKYLVVQALLLGALIGSCLLMVVALYAVDRFVAPLNLSGHYLNWSAFLIFWGRIYLTVLAISAFQFWLGLRFKSFIVPIIIGIALLFAGAMMMEEHPWVHDNKFPYIYPLRNCFPKRPSDQYAVIWGSLGYTVLFLLLGLLDFNRRRSTP